MNTGDEYRCSPIENVTHKMVLSLVWIWISHLVNEQNKVCHHKPHDFVQPNVEHSHNASVQISCRVTVAKMASLRMGLLCRTGCSI